MTLDKLKTGECGRIISVRGEGELRHHLLDMGLTPGTEVSLRKTAPMGDPVQLVLRGYELTLRLAEAAKIEIVSIESMTETKKENERHQPIAHPGVGELGKARDYRKNRIGNTIPKGEPITFALAGNQNCGKTTLFNQLTGSNQHVGNFPGVTVDKKEGSIRRHPEATVTDLPGIYSLSPYSSEEIVTRDFLLNEKPTGIINIVDASNIERNLYLTMQLMELGIPMVLALNMMDEVRANGGSVRINELEEILGIPVAIRNDNVVTVVINNSLYGMTGGQCAPTSLPGQITTSTPRGKDPKKAGMPFRVEEAFTGFDIAYLARGSMADAKGMMQSKKYIRKAFEKHMKGEGFCLVELLSPCPTNLNMTPVKSVERIKNEMIKYFPLGEFKDKKEEA